jgi:hypothetical protein
LESYPWGAAERANEFSLLYYRVKYSKMFRNIIPASFSCMDNDVKNEAEIQSEILRVGESLETESEIEKSLSSEQLESIEIKNKKSNIKWPFLVPEFIAGNRSRWCAAKDPTGVMERLLQIMLQAGINGHMVDEYTVDVRPIIDCLPVTMRLTLFATSHYAPFARSPFLIECQKREGDSERWYKFESILRDWLPGSLFGRLVTNPNRECSADSDVPDDTRSAMIYHLIRNVWMECNPPSACGVRILLNELPGTKNESIYELMRHVVRYPDQFLELLFTGLMDERKAFFTQNANGDASYVRIYNELANAPLIETFINKLSPIIDSSNNDYWYYESLNCLWKIVTVCMKNEVCDQFNIIGKRLINSLYKCAVSVIESEFTDDKDLQLQMNEIRLNAEQFVDIL